MVSFNPHVSYKEVAARTWRVFLLGRWLGDIVRGSVSALFRSPSGRSRLFRDTEEIERLIALALQKRLSTPLN